jgi:hypothetical protein
MEGLHYLVDGRPFGVGLVVTCYILVLVDESAGSLLFSEAFTHIEYFVINEYSIIARKFMAYLVEGLEKRFRSSEVSHVL